MPPTLLSYSVSKLSNQNNQKIKTQVKVGKAARPCMVLPGLNSDTWDRLQHEHPLSRRYLHIFVKREEALANGEGVMVWMWRAKHLDLVSGATWDRVRISTYLPKRSFSIAPPWSQRPTSQLAERRCLSTYAQRRWELKAQISPIYKTDNRLTH